MVNPPTGVASKLQKCTVKCVHYRRNIIYNGCYSKLELQKLVLLFNDLTYSITNIQCGTLAVILRNFPTSKRAA